MYNEGLTFVIPDTFEILMRLASKAPVTQQQNVTLTLVVMINVKVFDILRNILSACWTIDI